MVKTPNCVGSAGTEIRMRRRGAFGARGGQILVPGVPVVQVQHVLRHRGEVARGGSPPQSEHAEESKLELAEEALRLLRALSGHLAVFPAARLGDQSGRPPGQHLTDQHYHEDAGSGDHDRSVSEESKN